MSNMLSPVLLELYPQHAPGVSSSPAFRDATITATDPLKVRLDGDTDSIAPTKVPLVAGLKVGDRVSCLIDANCLTVLARYGGQATDANVVVIDGQEYPASGSVSPPLFTYLKTWDPVFVATIDIPVPYRPPDGWTFEVFCQRSSGYTFISTSNADKYQISARVMQVGNSDASALRAIGWRLTKQ